MDKGNESLISKSGFNMGKSETMDFMKTVAA